MRPIPLPELVRSSILLTGLALIGYLFIARRDKRWLTLAALALPIAAGVWLVHVFVRAWPIGGREVSLVRATVAVVALAALWRERFAPLRWPASRCVVTGMLGLSAAGAIAAFFNLGHPQFWDAKQNRPNFVHNHDMRVYYPAAKYFRELRYDGVYLASVAAWLDDVPGASPAHVQLRDLRTHNMRRADGVMADITEVRQRFSPERWRSFVVDMRYFRETMGEWVYLGSMSDHGANATPVWMGIAHVLFAHTRASNATLTATALLDPLLLLVAFVAIGATFGLRTSLVCAIVFGANDFYMFGSDWAGATLRHDWLAYAALGVCALHRERWRSGGALLALAAMIRAFPALMLAGCALPGLWWLVEHRRLPRWSSDAPLVRIAIGAGLCLLAGLAFTMVTLPLDAWGQWLHKAALLDGQAHVNHISLRALVAGNDSMQATILYARLPLFIALVGLAVVLVALAGRGKSPARGALLGLLWVPVVFNPANYYLHFVFLLPMLRRQLALWSVLLALCVLQYWTVLAPNWDVHFELATMLWFAAAAGLLITQRASEPPLGISALSLVVRRRVGDPRLHRAGKKR